MSPSLARSLALGMLWLGVGVVTTPASAQCLQGVFFDLGNTLVEDGGGGIFVLRTGADETIAGLEAAGIARGIITNVPAGWTLENLRGILADPEFLDRFDVVVLSSLAPAAKPDPAIYQFAYDALAPEYSIQETAFVGETLLEIGNAVSSPTLGARAVGMTGIHLSDAPPNPIADHTIATNDLPAVLEIVATSCPLVFRDGFESGDTSAWS